MLNFRTTNWLLLLMLVFTTIIDWYLDIPFFVYALLLLTYSLVVFWGCYAVQSSFFLPVVCAAVTSKKEIAISFDDGPVLQYTPELLQVLEELEVKAAFFCIGNRIPAQESVVQKIHQQGHLVGNHSYTHHALFDLFPSNKMLAELRATDDEIERVLGVRPKLFRPPYGVTNPNLKKAIEKGGYTPVGWSVRSLDTVIKSESTLLKRISQPLQPGAVYLFHDTSKATLSVLPIFVKWVRQSGYELVRLDHLLQLKAYA